MKKLAFLVGMVSMLLCSPVAFVSCSTTTSTKEAVVFRTLKDTWTLTFNAYGAFCERIVQGKVSATDEVAADRAWNRFRATFKAALLIAKDNMSAPAPVDVQTTSGQLILITK